MRLPRRSGSSTRLTYAAALASTFEHLELRCVLQAPPGAVLSAEVRFLAAGGARHEAVAHRVRLADATLVALADGVCGERGRHRARGRRSQARSAGPLLDGRSACARTSSATAPTKWRFASRTGQPCAQGLDRAGALAHSLLSTHPILRVCGGRFSSPLERPCASVNTYPVLASAGDDAVLGAAIVLPDHPQIAPESRGGLFDSTEIEEALLLHVKVLSDSEREEIERHDPRRLRDGGARRQPPRRMTFSRCTGASRCGTRQAWPRAARSARPRPRSPRICSIRRPARSTSDVDGVRFCRGGKVRIRPGPEADLHARMLDGRTATIERILIDYDGKTHLGVTVDDDPGQELLRDSGRYLFFFTPEVEVLR